MFHMPMSSPMMTTTLGRCPAAAGDGVGCCACAELVSPIAEIADAATRELPLNKRSRRFSPPPTWFVSVSTVLEFSSLLMTQSLFLFVVMYRSQRGAGAECSLSSAGAHFRAPALSHHARLRRLVAPVTGIGLLDLIQDATEVVALRGL